MGCPSPDQIKFILESGILAPSADNQHRLGFQVDDLGVNVWYTGESMPLHGGYKRALTLLNFGAVSENFSIAARRFGMHLEPLLFPDQVKPNLLFKSLWLSGVTDIGNTLPDWKTIPQRHTNRRIRYKGPEMVSSERIRLVNAMATWPDCNLTWLDEPHMRRNALHLMRIAEGERFQNKILHKELFDAIRFDVGWHKNSEEGLPPGALAIETPLQIAFTALRQWSLMQKLNRVGAHRILAWRAADLPFRYVPHLGVLSMKTLDDIGIFNAGRAFQRIWLLVTELGFVLQPLPASILYALENACHEGIPLDLKQRLSVGWKAILPNDNPIMLFRLGRAAPLTIHSDRKPLMSYIIN